MKNSNANDELLVKIEQQCCLEMIDLAESIEIYFLTASNGKNAILFKGTFSPQELESQFDYLRKYLEDSVVDEARKRRIIKLAIEQVDNLLSHSFPAVANHDSKKLCYVIALEHQNDQYVIHTQGFAQETQFERLKQICVDINRLSNRKAVVAERDACLISKTMPASVKNNVLFTPHAQLGISKMVACARDAIRIRFIPDNQGHGILSISSPC